MFFNYISYLSSTKKKCLYSSSSVPKTSTTIVKKQEAFSSASNWLNDSESDDEVSPPPRETNQVDDSVLTRRVPGGVTRQTAKLNGELVAELRLYNAKEVHNLTGFERCEKAIVWVRLQGEAESPELLTIKNFVKLAKSKFAEEGTFFSDKKKK